MRKSRTLAIAALVPFAAALIVGQILKKPEAVETGPTGAAL